MVATVGLAVNPGSALLVRRSVGASLNMRASFVHLATDAVGSAGAVPHVVVTGEPTLRDAQRTAGQVKTALAEQFAITNVTLELESPLLPDLTAPSRTTAR